MNKINKFKRKFPRRPLTGSKIHASLKDRLPGTKKKFFLSKQ